MTGQHATPVWFRNPSDLPGGEIFPKLREDAQGADDIAQRAELDNADPVRIRIVVLAARAEPVMDARAVAFVEPTVGCDVLSRGVLAQWYVSLVSGA